MKLVRVIDRNALTDLQLICLSQFGFSLVIRMFSVEIWAAS